MVFTPHPDSLTVGQKTLDDFEVEFGGMNYGFQINGILGMDFLLKASAVVDLGNLSLIFGEQYR